MRQIRPRTTHPSLAPTPGPTPLFVDLREDQNGDRDPERLLRAQLAQARQAVQQVKHQLDVLIDERDVLKARLEQVPTPGHSTDPDDRSIVPWGFCDEDLD